MIGAEVVYSGLVPRRVSHPITAHSVWGRDQFIEPLDSIYFSRVS